MYRTRLLLGYAFLTGCSANTPSVQRPKGKGKGKGKGCFIERLPDGEIIMHQRSYIDQCLKNSDMMMLKSAKGLPCVDEKSLPEDPYEDDGTPTSFETDKAVCQKYIGQLMWLTQLPWEFWLLRWSLDQGTYDDALFISGVSYLALKA